MARRSMGLQFVIHSRAKMPTEFLIVFAERAHLLAR